MSNEVIKVSKLSKMYRLGVINNGTLFQDIQTWAALKTGKNDPHSIIGVDKYASNKDHFWALKDLNFTLNQGDRVGIIGKNGAGKSTLLKILSRVTSPTEGQVCIRGKIASLLEVGTGFNGELTGRENIYLNGAILGMKKRQIDKKLDEIINFSGIDLHIDTPVKRYSSGMYVRLAFAVAAHLDSEILIADEVLAVGDSEFQKKALGKMKELSSGMGKTVLFVSHNLSAVKQLCNRGMILEKGALQYFGGISESINNYIGENNTNQSTFDGDDIIQKSPYIKIISINLTDEHGKKGLNSFTNNEKVLLEMIVDVLSIDKNLAIGFRLYNSEGETIFRSANIDLESSDVLVLPKGKNLLRCELPIKLLLPDAYRLNIEASLFSQEWIINPDLDVEYSIRFNINNVIFSTRHRTPCLISPPINWTCQQIKVEGV